LEISRRGRILDYFRKYLGLDRRGMTRVIERLEKNVRLEMKPLKRDQRD
jgi:hypothetical protein